MLLSCNSWWAASQLVISAWIHLFHSGIRVSKGCWQNRTVQTGTIHIYNLQHPGAQNSSSTFTCPFSAAFPIHLTVYFSSPRIHSLVQLLRQHLFFLVCQGKRVHLLQSLSMFYLDPPHLFTSTHTVVFIPISLLLCQANPWSVPLRTDMSLSMSSALLSVDQYAGASGLTQHHPNYRSLFVHPYHTPTPNFFIHSFSIHSLSSHSNLVFVTLLNPLSRIGSRESLLSWSATQSPPL